jgi:hypothetical protein
MFTSLYISAIYELYKQYYKARNELCKELLNLDHMSTYNPENMEIEKHYQMENIDLIRQICCTVEDMTSGQKIDTIN